MEREEYLLENFKNIQELIKFIDQKANFLMAVYAFMMTSFVAITKNLTFVSPSSTIEKLIFFVGASFIGWTIYQIYIIIFKIVRPRKAKNYNPNEASTFYFGHIKNMDRNDFLATVRDANLNVGNEISCQIFEVAKILNKKMDAISDVTGQLFGSIIILIIFTILTKFL